jgi:hypothetical protein
MDTRRALRYVTLALLTSAMAVVADLGVSDRGGETRTAEAAGPVAVRALAPDIVNYFVDGDQGPNAAIPGVGLITPEDGLNLIEIMFPGDQSSVLGGNQDFYPDLGETALLSQLSGSSSPSGPPQINITAGQSTTVGLAGKLTIVGHLKRPATHGGGHPGDAETGRVTFGATTPGFVYHEAQLALAAPHGQGPVDPTLASVTCGSYFSWALGFDPFTGEGKADFADGDCDGVIHGPLDLNDPLSLVGSCAAQYLVGPAIPNDPTCKEDSLVFAHLMLASPQTPLGPATATFTQGPAPMADLAGIGAPTEGGSGSAPFEVMGDPVGFLALQNPHCNDDADGSCVPDPLATGNAAPNECQPQPGMDLGNGGVVLAWDAAAEIDATLALALYVPVSAEGRKLTRHHMTWDSESDGIVHPQENFSVSFNLPPGVAAGLSGVFGADLLCSGMTAGTANVTVTAGSISSTFPVVVASSTSLALDMDITNGSGVCDPIDSSTNVDVGPAAVRVGVCFVNPLGTLPVSAFKYNVTYDDSMIVAPEVADVSPALEDNPDANAGVTTFTSPKYSSHLGDGWQCDDGGAFPKGDNNASTGAAAGNAFSGSCISISGPYTLTSGPLGVITFDAVGSGTSTVSFGGSSVHADDLSEIGSCNQPGNRPMPCVGGSVTVGGCPGAPNSDPEVRPNGPNIAGDDNTWPDHDGVGDLCDMDDDNDGLVDTNEILGVSCGGVPTLPSDLDSDDDHLHDGWECANGSNPLNPASMSLGPPATDVDGDHVPDVWENRGYNSSGGNTDSDGDGCSDMVEIGSVNGNRALDDGDRLAVTRRALNLIAANSEQDYVLDVSKNGVIDDSDRLFVTRAVVLPDWLPKGCL